MRGGLTVDVYIPKGILKEPGALTKLFWFIGSNPAVLLPLGTLAVMAVLWWYKGRDPDPGMSVAPMYEPPEGVSPARRKDVAAPASTMNGAAAPAIIDEKASAQEQKIARAQLQQMVHYAESSECRRVTLLRYFGEKWPEQNCGG